jgi:hypothetical protein
MTAGRAIWGAIVVILGLVLLAANFGWVDWGFVISLWQLWPLILILIGLGMLFRDSNRTLGAVLMLVVVLLGVGLAWVSYEGLGVGRYTTTRIDTQATSGFTSARAEIDVGAATLSVVGGETGRMVTGTSVSRRPPELAFAGSNGFFRFTVSQKWQNFIGLNMGRNERLDLTLAERVPWTIEVGSGGADMRLDLTRVLLAGLSVNTGASSLNLTVGPEVMPDARVSVNGGAAGYEIALPRSLNITVRTSTGLTTRDFDRDFSRSGDTWTYNGGGNRLQVEVKSGVSTLHVRLY